MKHSEPSEAIGGTRGDGLGVGGEGGGLGPTLNSQGCENYFWDSLWMSAAGKEEENITKTKLNLRRRKHTPLNETPAQDPLFRARKTA